MLCLHTKNKDPYYNLAAEEFLLKNTGEDVFLLWQSTPVIVVGKHQNTLAEINYRFIRSNDILIARRLTGGGAVYHDPGNFNFTFIRNGEQGKLVNFGSFIEPVISFLKTLGIEANRGLKNEILVSDRKISGNAEHVYKNRVLHHGTLLYNTDLNMLRESLRSVRGIYTDRAVQSNRSSVMNLAECIIPAMSMQDFQDAFFDYIMNSYCGRLFQPEENQKIAIRQLAYEKYNTWDWIYGWSPDYAFENLWRGKDIEIAIALRTHRGIITWCSLKSQVIPSDLTAKASDKLMGTSHEENNIRMALEESEFRSILDNREFANLVLTFF
jgi:lipoate-protein ligase A